MGDVELLTSIYFFLSSSLVIGLIRILIIVICCLLILFSGRSGGMKGLFTGVGPRVARAGPSVGIVISFYEVVKYALHERHTSWASFVDKMEVLHFVKTTPTLVSQSRPGYSDLWTGRARCNLEDQSAQQSRLNRLFHGQCPFRLRITYQFCHGAGSSSSWWVLDHRLSSCFWGA